MPTIAELNDAVRKTLFAPAQGTRVLTAGVYGLPAPTVIRIIAAVRDFDTFPEDDEHDFGALTVGGHKLFWKIDYYDRKHVDCGSPDPADPEKTLRVLTIMLAEEY